MWQKEQGILLSSVKYNDRNNVVHIFTRSHGYISFIFHLAKTGRNASRNTLLQPLTQIEFDYQFNSLENLQHMREPSNSIPYTDIPFNHIKKLIVLFLSEFLSYTLKEETRNERLYDFISSSLNWLDKSQTYSNFHLVFMLGITQLIGICPNSDRFMHGCYFDLQDGEFCTSQPSHVNFLTPELSYKMYRLISSDFDNMDSIPLTRSQRIQLINSLNDYFRLHIPSFPTLKATEVLESIFE